jgi:SAM-dependent methyltransferase
VSSPSAHTATQRPFYAGHADAYDLLITDPAGPWVDAVHDRLVRAGRPAASILDAGCGTGRHAAGLIARGHHVDLVDASPALLARAAGRCPSARAFRADLCALSLDRTYHAVTCRGVLNDMVTDQERDAVLRSLAGALCGGGLLLLDVREEAASRERADGVPRTRTVEVGPGRTLTFTSTTTWRDGALHVEEHYDAGPGPGPSGRSSYRFVMRPWSRSELHRRLTRAGFGDIEIAGGAGRRTPDRLFVAAARMTY